MMEKRVNKFGQGPPPFSGNERNGFFLGGVPFPYLLKRTLREAAFLRLDVDDMVLMDEERALLGA